MGPGIAGGVQGNRHERPAQARRLDAGATANGLAVGSYLVYLLTEIHAKK